MKKLIALLLVLVMAISLAACASNEPAETEAPVQETEAPAETEAPVEETEAPVEDTVKVMTYAEFAAAELETEVVVETYVQTIESWWNDQCHIYAASEDGGYYIYGYTCTQEEADKLVPGTKIRVTGYKGAWAGEVEIMDATFEFVKDADTYIAEAKDLTDKLGTDDLIKYQNQFASFKGLTVVKVEYQGGEPGKDIYVTVSLNDKEYSFCVESYLPGTDSDVYKTVGTLKAGDKVDIEGFVYWYEGINTHITSVTVK